MLRVDSAYWFRWTTRVSLGDLGLQIRIRFGDGNCDVHITCAAFAHNVELVSDFVVLCTGPVGVKQTIIMHAR